MTKKRKTPRVALYARVSTDGQTTENQLRDLRAVAETRGWDVIEEFVDHGISGAKNRNLRPHFDAMLKSAERGRIDVIAAWRLDRLGRRAGPTIMLLDDMRERGVDVYLHKENIDTGSPTGRAMLQMISVMAELEREATIERIHAGLDRARAQGKRLGRPPINEAAERRIRRLLSEGTSYRKAAAEAGVSLGVVQRIAREMSEEAA